MRFLLGYCGSAVSLSQGLSSFKGGLSVQLTSLGSANCSLPLPLSGPFRPVALSATSPGDQFSSLAVLTLFTPLKNTLTASPP